MSGKYRHRVDLIKRTLVKDGFGDEVETWVSWRPAIPAEVVPLSGKEFIAAGAERGQLKARVEIPYLPGVEEEMRLRHDDQEYEIQAVLADATARRHLTLMVASRKENA